MCQTNLIFFVKKNMLLFIFAKEFRNHIAATPIRAIAINQINVFFCYNYFVLKHFYESIQ